MEHILALINPVAMLVVVAYILGRTDIYAHAVDGVLSAREKVLIVLIFGMFSIYGTVFGIKIADTTANIRDLGPMAAGIIAGPATGVAAGAIGAVHRFLLGGITRMPCTIATILAGLAGGVLCMTYREKLVPLWLAGVVMACFEGFHMLLVLAMNRSSENFDKVADIVREASIPMIAANALGIVLILHFTRSILRERKTLAEKVVFENELRIGRSIQESLLPMIFPPFPDRREFELYADNIPAKEVAGDFYDFFFIEEDRLAIIIADVSGKGVSAGLFMAITRTLIKVTSDDLKDPAGILEKTNRVLSLDNEACMFTTMFLAVYNVKTGKLEFANAGHNPPLIIHTDGEITKVCVSRDPVLGIVEEQHYHGGEITLEKDQTLVLYTDGITEAVAPDGEFYGEENFSQLLKENRGLPLEGLAGKIESELEEFQQGEQFDDITFLLLRRKV